MYNLTKDHKSHAENKTFVRQIWGIHALEKKLADLVKYFSKQERVIFL